MIRGNNKGFSLVELLTVIAIAAVASAVLALSYIVVNNANVSKAIDTLEAGLNNARVTSMSKGKEAGKIRIFVDDDCLYYAIGSQERVRICTPAITPCYYNDVTALPGGMGTPCGGSFDITIYFNSTGMVNTTDSSATNCIGLTRDDRKMAVMVHKYSGKVEVGSF